MQPMSLTQIIDFAGSMLAASTCAAIAGGLLGGFLYSLFSKSLTHVADRIADRMDPKREVELSRLRAECWRLRARNSRGGV